MKRRGLVASACTLALVSSLAFAGGSAQGASRDNGACTWGASSVTASYVNGELVMSQPHTTGCIPAKP
jgi:hypothetical protein